MAQIPLINAGQAQLVDTGIQVAQTAQLQAGGGAAAWGQALQNVGEMGVKFVQQRQKANDANTMIELEGKMRDLTAAQMDYQKKEQNQEEWGKAWDTRVKEFEANTLKKARLSPDAKMALAETFGRFSQGQSLSIQEQATSQAKRRLSLSVDTMFQREAQAANLPGVEQASQIALAGGMLPEEVEAKKFTYQQAAIGNYKEQTKLALDNLANTGDTEGVNLMLDDPEVTKHYTAEEVKSLRFDFTEKAKSATVQNQVMNDLAEDPPGEVMRLDARNEDGSYKHYPEIGQAQRVQLIQEGQRMTKVMHNDMASQLQEKIVGRDIRSMKDLEKPENLALYSKLPPTYKAQIDQMLQEGPITDPGEYQKAITRIEATDLTDGPEVASTQRYLKMFAPEEQKMLLERLDNRMASTDKTPKVTADLFQQVDKDLEDGLFGNFRLTGEKIEITDGTGRAQFKTIDNLISADEFTDIQLSEKDRLKIKTAEDKKVVIVEDLTKKRAASQKVATIKAQMEKMISDGKSPFEVSDWYDQQMQRPRLDSARSIFDTERNPLYPSPAQLQFTPEEIEKFQRENLPR